MAHPQRVKNRSNNNKETKRYAAIQSLQNFMMCKERRKWKGRFM